jgi:hypothetical protein
MEVDGMPAIQTNIQAGVKQQPWYKEINKKQWKALIAAFL